VPAHQHGSSGRLEKPLDAFESLCRLRADGHAAKQASDERMQELALRIRLRGLYSSLSDLEELFSGVSSRLLYGTCLQVRLDDRLDLVQDAMLRILCKFDQWSGESNFLSWAYQILRHVRADAWRKEEKKARIESLDEGCQVSIEYAPDELLASEMEAEEMGRIRLAVERLSPRQKAVLVSKYFEGLENREIAALLGIPGDRVKNALNKALERVRVILSEPALSRGRGVAS